MKDDKRIDVVCLECDKRFKTASYTPSCPRCHGSDIEVADAPAKAVRS
jgi:Zn finger protein HypA/HybF involved in hydrogenase expression